MIDMARLQQALARGDVRDLTRDVPEGLASARLLVNAMLDELTETLAPSHLVLGGFSQGAMLSADVVLRSERTFAGLVLLSGTMIAEPCRCSTASIRPGMTS